jgi:hypothetical protein
MEKILGTKEVAAKLKIEPRYLRVVLRSLGKGTGKRYEWKEGDPFLAKLPALIKKYEEAEAKAKETEEN